MIGVLRRAAPPDSLLPLLVADLTFAERCDAAITVARGLSGTDSGYLYMRDPSGRRLRLAHRCRGTSLEPAQRHLALRPTAGAALPPSAAGAPQTVDPRDVDLAEAGPSLELDPADESLWDTVVATPAGGLYSMVLRVDGGEPLGLLLLGPVHGALSGDARRSLEERRLAFTTVFQVARALRDHEERLTATEAALESASRLQESALGADQFFELLLDLAVGGTSATGGFVSVVDEVGELRITTSRDLPTAFTDEALVASGGLFDWFAAEAGVLVVRDLELAARCGFTSILAVPLMEADQRLGVFAIFRTTSGPAITADALDMLAAFAEQARLMLTRSRTFDAFSREFVGTLAGLARSMDARAPHTRGHHRAVEQAATAIAAAMGLDEAAVGTVAVAASIHDVGSAALAQQGRNLRLSDTDHPAIGASLVSALPGHAAVAAAVATHHEWFDGWGFPEGLRGEAIPLSGRILAVAEFLAEMAAGNPLRQPLEADGLANELRRRSGSQFDPDVALAAAGCVTVVIEALAGAQRQEES